MTRVFLAAGVAALAIAAPASAGPHGGGKAERPAQAHGNGGGGQRHGGGGGGGGFAAPRMQQPHAQHAQRMAMPRMQQQHGQRFASVQRPQHSAQAHQQRGGRAQTRMVAQQHARGGHAQAQHQQRTAMRQQAHGNHAQAQAQNRQQVHGNREQAQNRQQMRANRVQQAQQMRANRMEQVQNRMANNQQLRAQRMNQVQTRIAGNGRFSGQNAVGYGVGGCPPGLASKGCMPPGQAMLQGLRSMPVQNRAMALRNLGDARYAMVDFAPQRQILAPAVASALIGMPLTTAASFGTFSPFPQDLGYLYPSTANYYYQYGNGYAYQIDRGSNLIAALIPLLAGGYYPGSYLPQAYMSSYVPDYYGLNSFYPASYAYGGYGGYGAYSSLCNRYAYGVVYQVDCMTGMVENVIPTYAGGYGVGQMLPSSYSYYNVPYQYRSMYYDTPDYGYWYAPGAIYQYDRGSSLITSVAALMSPGFTIGQAMPVGYGMYNVPLAYRATYYDTPNAWYRYNNGYIYQVDPATQLVTAVVASLLT